MKIIKNQHSFPDSWKISYDHDLVEIYGADNRSGYYYSYANRFRNVLSLIRKHVSPEAKILDVAAAQGNYSLPLAELGYDVTWNDIREELVDYVKAKYERGSIHFLPGNIFECNFDYQFDLVLMGELIEHTAHPDRLLRRIVGLVKKGGYVLITTPNGEYFQSGIMKFSDCQDPSIFENAQFKPDADGHIFGLHLSEFYNFARILGLSIVDMRIINNSLTSGHIKLGLLLKILPKSFVEVLERFTNVLPLTIKRRINSSLIIIFKRL